MTLLIILVFFVGMVAGWILAGIGKKISENEFFTEPQTYQFPVGYKTNPGGNPPFIFHGGCLGCTMQSKRGLAYCTGCRYFECNWSLPSLNDESMRRELHTEAVRQKAKSDSHKNKGQWS